MVEADLERAEERAELGEKYVERESWKINQRKCVCCVSANNNRKPKHFNFSLNFEFEHFFIV